MELVVLIALAAIIIILIGVSFSQKGAQKKTPSADPKEKHTADLHTCPLCGSTLKKGERVRSVFYPSPGDTMAEIHGCRHCEGEAADQQRICPVCKKPVAPKGYVIARVFKRPGKTHVHVVGCTGCRSTT